MSQKKEPNVQNTETTVKPHGGQSHLTDLLDVMTDAEKSAALRFCETCDDDEDYDVPKPMMKRLAELGLVKSLGFGRYEQTDLLLEARSTLEDAPRHFYGYPIPHPRCDEGCMYHCTEGGTRPPKCNEPSNVQITGSALRRTTQKHRGRNQDERTRNPRADSG
jgi:hypothetical protein